MNAIEHWVAQNKDVPLLQAKVNHIPDEKSDKGKSCIVVYGRQIEALHVEGMTLKDIAKQLGLNYNGLRGIYSRYRRIKPELDD